MKIYYCLFVTFLLFIQGYCMHDLSENESQDKGRLAYRQMVQTADCLKKKYGIKIGALGQSAMDGLSDAFITFTRRGEIVTEEEARCMIIDCIHSYLRDFNHNQALRSYYKEYPLTEKNFGISIIFEDCNGREFPNPHLASVRNTLTGKITYNTRVYDPAMEMTYFQMLSEETYEEALRILGLQKPIFDQ